MRLPRLIASSVVRGAALERSHGGLCIVDLERGKVELALDWNATDIDIAGRGGDRGLRGICVVGEDVWVMSSQELLRFDRAMQLQDSYANRYLKHCHEISGLNGILHIVSTGYDSILSFDTQTRRFTTGLHLRRDSEGLLRALVFDPVGADGPAASNVFHLNNVFADDSGLYFSGLRTGALLKIAGGRLANAGGLPRGTHNARPYGGGIMFNDTANDRFCHRTAAGDMLIPVAFDWQSAPAAPTVAPETARPLFARGLCQISENLFAGGVSPSTILVFDLSSGTVTRRVSISSDIRNAIHGLALWGS